MALRERVNKSGGQPSRTHPTGRWRGYSAYYTSDAAYGRYGRRSGCRADELAWLAWRGELMRRQIAIRTQQTGGVDDVIGTRVLYSRLMRA